MTREAISTTNAPQAVGPYSQAIVVGDLIFCAGQGAIDPQTQDLRQGSVEEETERTLRNLGAVLDKLRVMIAIRCATIPSSLARVT